VPLVGARANGEKEVGGKGGTAKGERVSCSNTVESIGGQRKKGAPWRNKTKRGLHRTTEEWTGVEGTKKSHPKGFEKNKNNGKSSKEANRGLRKESKNKEK